MNFCEGRLVRAQPRVGDRHVRVGTGPRRIHDNRKTRRRARAEQAHARPLGRAWHRTATNTCGPHGPLPTKQRAEMAFGARTVPSPVNVSRSSTPTSCRSAMRFFATHPVKPFASSNSKEANMSDEQAKKDNPPSPIIDHVEAGQTFIFIRLLIGKLHEAWELFRARVLTDRAISTTFLPKLPSEAANALTALKKHFGQGSALTAIRNKVSFHYTDKENLMEANFQQLAAPLQFYVTAPVGNCFYHAGELVAQLSAINLMKMPPAGPQDTSSTEERAFNALCTEIIQVSRDMTELFS